MKKTTLAKLIHSLETETIEVELPADIIEKAKNGLKHMLVS
jgi:quinolinate synthase